MTVPATPPHCRSQVAAVAVVLEHDDAVVAVAVGDVDAAAPSGDRIGTRIDPHVQVCVKSDNGGRFETITDVADVIKLAGRGGAFDLESEFGVSADRKAALDRVTQLAIAVGLDALRDAGIPLVLRYKTTTRGTQLPDRWALPDTLRDDTGVIFASAFPGLRFLR